MNAAILTPEHLSGAARLERLCFPEEPWSETSLRILCGTNALGRVVTDENGAVIAYGGMTFAADEGSVTNIAVDPDFRRRGYGRCIVTALTDAAREHGLSALYLEVRVSNVPAIALYRSLGFTETGQRKNFYRHPTEDALLLKKQL